MLYTEYRPITFDEVVGQENNLLTIRQQIKTKKYDHAYLFAGYRGTGKTTIARILGRTINCENPTENGPCNKCKNCLSILKNSTMDFVELDAASHNSISDIKDIVASTKYVPTHLSKKIYIIDEVHNLSTSAFDALLKTIEEPPEHCIFILCTTELHKIPSTIRSRCTIYQFQTLSIEIIAGRLAHVMKDIKKDYDDLALDMIAKQADGSMRDALSIAEKMIISCDKLTVEVLKKNLGLMDEELSLSLINAIICQDSKFSIEHVQRIKESGKNMAYFIENTIQCMTDGVLLYTSEGKANIYNTESYQKQLYHIVTQTTISMLFWYIETFSLLREKIRNSLNPYMEIMLCVIKCCNPKLFSDQVFLMNERITAIEDKLNNPSLLFTQKEEESSSLSSEMQVEDTIEDEKGSEAEEKKLDVRENQKDLEEGVHEYCEDDEEELDDETAQFFSDYL